jgi:biopolymer transport protein ExbD
MSRFRETGADTGEEKGIDISPLIDCVFILLIFFIVTTVFVEEPGVEVDKAQAASLERLEKNSILIALTRKGEVMYANREIGVNGVRPQVERILRKEMVPVIILADRGAPNGKLIRVIEEVKRANSQVKVSIATRRAAGA